MPWSCVPGACSRSGGSGPVLVLASALGLLPALASLVVRGAGRLVRVSLPFAYQYAIPCGLCNPRARSGCPSGPRRVSVACVCARAPAALAPPPPRVSVGAGCSRRLVPLRVSCLGPVLCLFRSWGDGPVPSSPCLAWGCSPACVEACFYELALRTFGAAQWRPGGMPLAWVWGVRGWALSYARALVLRMCGQGPLPAGCGCEVCGRGDPSPTPRRALSRAGFAPCRGGTRAPRWGGGASLAWVWGVRR